MAKKTAKKTAAKKKAKHARPANTAKAKAAKRTTAKPKAKPTKTNARAKAKPVPPPPAPSQVVVLAPEQSKGFIVETDGVDSAVQLFVLLEDVLVGDPASGLLEGPRTEPEIAAMARGERHPEGSFSIGWHYEYWFGVRPSAGAALTGLHPAIAAMIGIEAAVARLPAVRDQIVILMKPKQLAARFCDAGFLHSHGSRLAIQKVLAADEVATWLRELDTEAQRLESGS